MPARPAHSTAAARLGTRLDHLPPAVALASGVAGTTLIVAPWALRGDFWWAAAGATACLTSAVLLAVRARPIAVLVRPTPETFPEPLDMIELEGGTFLMGSPEGEPGRDHDEGPQHEVTVSPFAMAKVPTTQRLYRELMAKNPGSPKGDDLPVNNVTFFDAVRFCNALSKRVGLEPCYAVQGQDVKWNRAASGYRLPTEAEWEYAARAGTRTRYSFGDDDARLGEYAWFGKNASDLQPVGKKRANPWGLYDLYGNVWEWCWDRHGAYKAKSQRDPVGDESFSNRVLRGGSFYGGAWLLRSAGRGRNSPGFRLRNGGFRCVRGSRRQPGG
jgi:sulfatase modifying factor 1